MAATLKRPEETMPSLISRACGGSSSAVRSDSRPGTAQESPRATTLRHPVERQLVERSVDNTLARPASG